MTKWLGLLLAGSVLACSRSPFEDEAQGAVPPRPQSSPGAREEEPSAAEPVAAAASAPAVGSEPYAVIGRSSEGARGRRFDWPASGVRIRFRGDSLRVVLEEHGHDDVGVSLDGAPWSLRSLHPGENEVLVTEPGEHVLTLAKRTEAREGYFVVRGVTVAGGTLLPAPVRRRLEVLGDSISAGFGIEPSRADGTCAFVPGEENALDSYAARVATAHDLDLTLLAVSSKTTRQMTTFFERAWPSARAPAWQFGEAPAAVVLLLGTNDFFFREPDRLTFELDVLALLGKVRSHYGEVPVVLALSPMLSDSFPHGAQHRTLARKYMQSALSRAEKAGAAHVHWVELDEPTAAAGKGCSSHPNAATHDAMARTLSRFFDQERLLP